MRLCVKLSDTYVKKLVKWYCLNLLDSKFRVESRIETVAFKQRRPSQVITNGMSIVDDTLLPNNVQ